MLKLKFEEETLQYWSSKYEYNKQVEEDTIINVLKPTVQKRGYLTKEDFRYVCKWKTERSKSRCDKNPDSYIEEITKDRLIYYRRKATY